jgi:mono/diheme cytochrome c family protein
VRAVVLVAIAALFLLVGCGDAALQRMQEQPKALPYRESPFFEDQRSMRTPPEGTVPRERQRATAWRADAGSLRELPIPLTAELLERGRHHFEIRCATCHGLLGDGQSLIAQKMSLRPPPSLLRVAGEGHDHSKHTPGYYFEVISHGRGLMPSYAAEIPPIERWGVVAYLQALQLSQSARLDDAPPEVQQKLREAAP